jgi:hypothetical protein
MTESQLRDGSTVEDPRFNRLPLYDPRSLDYPVRTLLSVDQPLVTKLWTLPPTQRTNILDQGTEGSCCGFAVTNELRYYPTAVAGLDAAFAREAIYWGAQKIDPWPGGAYPGAAPRYEGTAVIAAIKAAQQLGFYGQYRWALSEDDLARSIGQIGPAVLGLTWTRGMLTPDSSGFIHFTGDPVGGHCVLAVGINVRSGYYTIQNSWGIRWGNRGTCKISRTELAQALTKANKGEACVVIDRLDPTRPGQPANRPA